MPCPCGSDHPYEVCCGPFHSGALWPPTAEALMRSRYTAYVRGDIDYVARTLAPESRDQFDPRTAASWAKESEWLGLKIVKTERGGITDDDGVVEFVATYRQGVRQIEHRERSIFRRSGDDRWLFVRGGPPAKAAKVGRNDPCPCGSGKKYKLCCGA